jgi:hypothetical protein
MTKPVLRVIDSWAMVAWIADEPAAPAMEDFLSLPSLPIQVDVPDEAGVIAAARVKASHAVAYGDSFAIALAHRSGRLDEPMPLAKSADHDTVPSLVQSYATGGEGEGAKLVFY